MSKQIKLVNYPPKVYDLIIDTRAKMEKMDNGEKKQISKESAVMKLLETHQDFKK